MYYGIIDGKTIPAERLQWVKLQPNGVYVNCSESEGQGIVLEGAIYHVNGRASIDKPSIDLVWQDDIATLKSENELLKECILEISEELYGGA